MPLPSIRLPKWAACVLCAVSLSLGTGCTTFHSEWRQAAKTPATPDDITGRWEGFWLSNVNGHRGRLRCVVSQQSPEAYLFHYRATYKRILSGSYRVTNQVSRAGQEFKMTGGSDLGKLYGGLYSYEGTATATHFFSTYRSAHDHGTFEMERLPPGR